MNYIISRKLKLFKFYLFLYVYLDLTDLDVSPVVINTFIR